MSTYPNIIAAKDARIAELEAEVGRLKHDGFLARVARYFDASELAGSFLSEDGDGGFLAAIHGMTKEIARLRAEALSRTGGVKVEVLVDGLLDLRDLIMRGKRCVTDSGPAVKPVIELAVVHILDDAATALEALSPAPEAQQEPVGEASKFGDVMTRAVFNKARVPAGTKLYTRPAEQAVTEAMVRAAAEILLGRVNAPEQEIYSAAAAALKAAMEAGR